ncbi:unnamed protein product [Cochlearia groenlandica]
MGSSIKINSISIDLADEINKAKCEHFSIRGFVAEIRERDHRKCWPFSTDTVELGDTHQSYSLPSLTVLKSRWWRCPSCIRDINTKEIINHDCLLKPRSRSVIESKLDVGSSAMPNKRKLKSLIGNGKKEKKNDKKKATLLKKVCGKAKDSSIFKRKSKKLAKPDNVNKRRKEKVNISMKISRKKSREAVNTSGEAMTAFRSSDIAGVVDDTPEKTSKKSDRNSRVLSKRDGSDNNVSPGSTRSLLGMHRRKTRKVRLLSELLSDGNKRTPSKTESVRGRKRKYPENEATMTNYASRVLSTIGKTSEKPSKSCDSEENTVSAAESRPSDDSQSTDSGLDREPIKGKQRNRRFQVAEERFPETLQKNPYDYSSFAGKELVPCTLHTQRTEKEPGLVQKRKRKAMIDNKKSTVITFGNNMDDRDLTKPRKTDRFSEAGPRDTMPQSTRDLLNSKWLDRSLDKFLEPDGHFDKYTPQVDDRRVFPFSLQEKLHYKDDDLAIRGTNYFRDFGSYSTTPTNADGCLRGGVNVDFSSNRNTTRPSSMNDKLKHISFTEVGDSSRDRQKDISVARNKGKEVAVQELSAAPRIQSNTSEHMDDIPMEIVELMAKNQYERCLPDKEEDKQPTSSVSKNALLIDLNETYDYSMENTLRQPKHLGSNTWNGEATATTNKQSSLEFFPTSQFGQQPYNNVPSGFAFNRENQSSSIHFTGLVGPNRQSSGNSQWLGNVPTTMANHHNQSQSSFRVLRPCNTCQSVQQHQYREAPHPIWPSSMASSHGHRQTFLNMSHTFMDHHHQSTKLDNPNTMNLSFGNERISSKTSESYSNESSIPAMHLLSLMDPRLRSNIPIDQNRNTTFMERPFSPVNQLKELTGIQHNTKQWPFGFCSTTPETSRENFAVVPQVGTSSFPFQSQNTSAENSDLTFKASWNHRHHHHQEKQSKRKDNNFTPIYNNNNHHHQKPIFPSTDSDPGRFRLLGASDSMALPLKFHMKDKAKKHKTRKPQSNNNNAASAWPPPTSTPGFFFCSVNRNPADFTVADAPGNVYMIKGEDLKLRKDAGFRKKQSLYNKQNALKGNKNSIAPATENA